MFKKPFNREVGEERQCKKCGHTFHTHKPIWRCKPCMNIEQKKYNTANFVRKEQYPFSNKNSEANNRFSKIRTKMNKAWRNGREAITEHYTQQLKEIEENGIMDWINDRRDNYTKLEKIVKSRNRTTKEFPDTRGWYEE